MTDTKPIRRIAIIGTGVIGASWTALFLAKGLEVIATDIAPNAEASLRKFVETAWPALNRLGLSPGASQSNLNSRRRSRKRSPTPTSSRRTGPSASISSRSSMGSSTSCCRPTSSSRQARRG